MTRTLLALSAFAMMGCSNNDLRFEHASQLVVHTDGVAMSKTGDVSIASMFGTTCLVETNSGMIGTDYDVPASDSETIEDISDEDIVLVKTDGAVHLVSPFGGQVTFSEYDGMGIEPSDVNSHAFTNAIVQGTVRKARFGQDSLMMLTQDGDCSVDWFDFNRASVNQTVQVDDTWCRSDVNMAVDRASGVAYLAGPDGVLQVHADSVEPLLLGAVRDASWAADLDTLYAAQGNIVQAVGALDWSTQLDAPVTALEVLGERGVVAAMLDHGSTGELALLDALSGDVFYRVATPAVARDLTASLDGSSLAVELAGEVHFFRVK